MLMAGGAAHASHTLDALTQRGAGRAAFDYMPTVEGNQIEVSALEIQAEGGRAAQPDRMTAPVGDPRGAGNQVTLFEHAVVEFDPYLRGGILQKEHQRFGLFLVPKKGRQALKAVFALFHLKTGIPQVRDPAAILQLQINRRDTEISHTAGGILLWERVQRVVAVVPDFTGIGGEAAVGIPNQIGQVSPADARAIIGMEQHPVAVRFHLIGGVTGVEGKKPLFFVTNDHNGIPSHKHKNLLQSF